jgi:radical SAM protein with 4Fe4S-binding SPASM domain
MLDEARDMGVLWLCFTGGDPLTRRDFIEVYSYAKERGFLVSVFTNGYNLNSQIRKCFRRYPPFIVEATVPSIKRSVYDKICGCKNAFGRAISNLKELSAAGIPLKIKTQLIKQNYTELGELRLFAKTIMAQFSASAVLYPRLNGDMEPWEYRLSPEQVKKLEGSCRKTVSRIKETNGCLFPCTVETGSGFHIDPSGYVSVCQLIRESKNNALKLGLRQAYLRALKQLKDYERRVKGGCADCRMRRDCAACPGVSFLAAGELNSKLDYYCRLAGKQDQLWK